MIRRSILALAFAAAMARAATPQADHAGNKGKAELNRCGGCHGARIIATQRLSRAGWERELDKMVRWGAEIKERAALLDYLVAQFGDDKPMPKPSLSVDGTTK